MDMTVKSLRLRLRNVVFWVVAAGAAVSVAAAPIADAEPILPVPGGGPASEAIQQLQSAGYNVSINWLGGHPNVPVSEGKATCISGRRAATATTPTAECDTVYVRGTCPHER